MPSSSLDPPLENDKVRKAEYRTKRCHKKIENQSHRNVVSNSSVGSIHEQYDCECLVLV